MKHLTTYLALLTFFLASDKVSAHFPWLACDSDGHALLFFGEDPDERAYHLPEAVGSATVLQHTQSEMPRECVLADIESEAFIGKRSKKPVDQRAMLQATIPYGVYHGTNLTYYAQHASSLDESPSTEFGKQPPRLYARVQRTSEDGLRVGVFWDNQPLAKANVQLYCEEDQKEAEAFTDDKGYATFSREAIESSFDALLISHLEENQTGEIDGKQYESASHYLTMTFRNEPSIETDSIPPLPEPVASFGAAVSDGWLYVYSGHKGGVHEHSRDNLSKSFLRTKLDGTSDWQELPMGPPLQGLALVAHEGKLYRIGGLDARNASGEEESLHSVSSFACFDPEANHWQDLPPLPNGRSSHDAVVVDNVIYVVGGWKLHGDDQGEWQTGAMALDLSDIQAGWRTLPEPPFRRRALALGHANGQLVAICGMNNDAQPTCEVSLFDLESNQWKAGPPLPGEPFHGFGIAARNVDGRLFAGGMGGVVYRLEQDLAKWTEVAKFATPRFFHQLLPGRNGHLLAVAGASYDSGHLDSVEEIHISEK